MSPVSEKQTMILQFIEDFHSSRGYPPSLREIGHHFKIKSPNGVKYHLKVLEREGLISRNPKTSRGLMTPSSSKGRKIPVVGRVAAGGPSLAYEEVEREVVLDPELFGDSTTDDLFALRVTGDSMKGAGIFEGDIAVVRRQRTANLGDVVVALMDGEATVKRYMPRNGYIVLQPENEDYAPIILKGYQLNELMILGRVVGLLRTRM